MASLGVFDPTLNIDTRLFVDPVLLTGSHVQELRKNASARFNDYFGDVVALLAASSHVGDAPSREAVRRLTFHEVIETCLGYGGAGIRGSAFGTDLRARILATAREIIALGVRDPEMFKLLPLLEEGIGSDRISDMTTHVILPDLLAYTARVSRLMKVPTRDLEFRGQTFAVPMNPLVSRASAVFRDAEGLGGLAPVILLPRDILRNLPVARDWGEVASAAARNAEVRRRVNEHVGAIWNLRIRTRKEKSDLRRVVLSSREAFEAMIATLHQAESSSYDFDHDHLNLYAWRQVSQKIALDYPLQLVRPGVFDADSVQAVVKRIIAQFKFLIEKRNLWRLLWDGPKARPESAAQLLFFAVAYAYCHANNLDIAPEADTGAGTVDFKVSAGFEGRVLVETKLSTNKKLVSGYQTQLGTYRDAEETTPAIYLVIDVGGMGRKDQGLARIRRESIAEGKPASEIVFVDGKKKSTASKR